MPLKDPVKRKAYEKKWREENREHFLDYMKRYAKANSERISRLQRVRRNKSVEKVSEYEKNTYERYKKMWAFIIRDLGMDRCSRCGYDRCSAAIEYHHPAFNPSGRRGRLSQMMRRKPSPEKIAELKKCIPLCANCHREEHYINNADATRTVLKMARQKQIHAE